MKNKKTIIACIAIVIIAASALLLVMYLLNCGKPADNRTFTTKVSIRNTDPVLSSQLPSDFVERELSDYEILGKWHVVGDDGYVIARKDGELWSTYYNKKDCIVGELIPLKERVENGDTIIYSEETFSSEYMIIRAKGLYIYGNNNLEPSVWFNEK